MARSQTAGKRKAQSPPSRVIGRANLPKGVSLVAFEAGLLPELKAGADLPDRLLILPWGRHETNKGLVICEGDTAALFNLNQTKWRRRRGVLDFQHNTVKGAPAYKGEPADIAARGTFALVEGEGVYLTALEWTPEGEKAYRNGHYEALSPAVVRDDAGNVILCDSAAMCRQGEIDGLTLFAAEADIQKLLAALAADESIETEEAMYRNLIITLLNACNQRAGVTTTLSADSTPEEISAAVEEYAKAIEGDPAKKPGDKVDGMSADVVTRAVESATKPLLKRLEAIESRGAQGERDAIIEAAARDGKIIPLAAETIGTMPVATLREMVENLPAGEVPTSTLTPGKVEAFASSANQSREAEAIRKNCGTNPESLKKWGKDLPARLAGAVTAAALFLGLTCAPLSARAANATSDLLTPQMIGQDIALGVTTNTTLFAGTIVAISNGYAVAASDAQLQTVVGRNERNVSNSGADGAVFARVRRGVFLWANSAADPVDADDVGKFCFVADDHTVAEGPGTGTNRAGVVVKVLGSSDSPTNGVWVDTSRVFHPSIAIDAGAVDTTAIAANAVTYAKLAAGLQPARVPRYWTNLTITAATPTNAITIAGTAVTNAVLVTPLVNGQWLSIQEARPTTDTVTLVTSIAPTNLQIAIGVFPTAAQ